MPSPSPYTAYIFDLVVRSLDRLNAMNEVALALEEYGLGTPLFERDLDLCYGLAAVDARLASNANAELVIGTGLVRYLNNAVPNRVHTGIPPEKAFNPTLLLGSLVVQDAYAFGSVFLRAWTSVGGPAFDVQVELVRGAGGGNPLLMLRDVPLSEALDWLAEGLVGDATVPAAPWGSTNYRTLEIMRFLINITYFDGNDSSKNRLKVIPVDQRRVRGALGFAEEALGALLVPTLVRGESATREQYAKANAAVKAMINQWVQLDSWQPNFLQYWQTSVVPMPARLRKYLEDELGYVV
jgi:hypothetical protein